MGKEVPIVRKVRKQKRQQSSLYEKLQVVLRYKEFLRQLSTKTKVSPDLLDILNDDDDEDTRSERSIKSFLKIENQNYQWLDEPLQLANVFKWLRAYDRGDFHDWGGINNLNKPNAHSKKILHVINDTLKAKFPILKYHQKVVKSKYSPDQYGVVARQEIPPGTFLGFFQGEVKSKTDVTYQPPSGPYAFTTVEGVNSVYVDNSDDFTACYARFYSSSTKEDTQNVTVFRITTESADPNKTICFVANKTIPPGGEFVIGVDQGYLRNDGYKRYKTAKCLTTQEEATVKGKNYLLAVEACGHMSADEEPEDSDEETAHKKKGAKIEEMYFLSSCRLTAFN
jgi:hypothetical protein